MLGTEAKAGQSLAREWTEFTVRAYGATRTAMLSSLRKKISLHINSAAHEKAVKITKINKHIKDSGFRDKNYIGTPLHHIF